MRRGPPLRASVAAFPQVRWGELSGVQRRRPDGHARDRPRRSGFGRRPRRARRTAQVPDPGDLGMVGTRRKSGDGNAQARHVFEAMEWLDV